MTRKKKEKVGICSEADMDFHFLNLKACMTAEDKLHWPSEALLHQSQKQGFCQLASFYLERHQILAIEL